MEEQLKTVSVIITACDRPLFLKTAIQSVLDQSYPILQIIIVDDSVNSSLEYVCQSFNSSKIVYYRNSQGYGASVSRNLGIDQADGEILAFLDDDDVYHPDKISRNISKLNCQSDCIAVLCSYLILEAENKVYKRDFVPGSGIIERDGLKDGNSFCGTSGLVAYKWVLALEKFDSSIFYGEDWDLYIRLTKHGFVYFDKIPSFYYRVGSYKRVTKSVNDYKLSNIKILLHSSIKNKSFLGEAKYKKRVSKSLLSGFSNKENKLYWFYSSIKYAGLSATILFFIKNIHKKMVLINRNEKTNS